MKLLRPLLLLLVAIGVAGCDFGGFSSWDWRQRLVLEVETPAGVISAGSVVAVHAGTSPRWLPGEGAGGLGTDVVGEASFIEVAPGRYLFALLGAEAERAFVTFFPRGMSTFERAEELETLRGLRDLPRKHYPMLVTFTDIADPKTVKRVDPNDLSASFGPGVTLRRIELEITEEPVTEGQVEGVLPWWCELRQARARLNGKTGAIADNELSNTIGTGAFRIGKCR